ncbi:MAG: 2-amino-4-hydroxy-6-hydroxymethyldihydropteridine diphosphokinase [Pseudomonadota bacterium]
MSEIYLIALGSNMRVPGIGSPRRVLAVALRALEAEGVSVLAAAPFIDSAPLGPSLRRYANGAACVETQLAPPELLVVLQKLERRFGRGRSQRRGQRWRARALDLDIILWSGGVWISPSLRIPHREMRARDFVLRPAAAIARTWRDPVTGLSLGALSARLMKPTRPEDTKKALNRTRG